ncbi:type 1 fimbrial protein, partial [Salmonella enterica]|nr:type 1 fimbrial protein [Salmonella enterica]
LFLSIWIFPFFSSASCILYSGNEINGYISFGNVIVQRDTPVGSVIATAITGAYNNELPLAYCTTPWTFHWVMGQWGTLSNLGSKIYSTNIPGVGIRLGPLDNNNNISAVPYDSPFQANVPVFLPDVGIKAELIKTGVITSGQLTAGLLVRGSILGDANIANVILNGVNNISAVSCDIVTPNIDVSLGEHQKREFSSPGTVTEWIDFSISLECNMGTNISITVNAKADDSGSPGVIKLDNNEGTATGIGIQLFMQKIDGTNGPVDLTNLIGYGKVLVNGTKEMKFQARYYQTAKTVTAGVANATATFTMTYQ